MGFLNEIPKILESMAVKKAASITAKATAEAATKEAPKAVGFLDSIKSLVSSAVEPLPDSFVTKFPENGVGKEFDAMWWDGINDAVTKRGIYTAGIRKAKSGLTKEQSVEINMALNDGTHKLPENLYTRKAFTRKLLNNFHRDEIAPSNIAQEKDIGFLDNYFPREWTYDELQKYKKPGKTREAVISKLMQDSNVSRNGAINILDSHLGNSARTKLYGPIDFHRVVDLPGYKLSDDVLYNYVDKSLRRTELAKRFGVNNEKVIEMAARLPEEKRQTFIELANLMLGPKLKRGALEEADHMGLTMVRGELVKRYMTYSALNNTWQGPIGSTIRTDAESTMRAMANVVKSRMVDGTAERAYLDELGAIQSELTDVFQEYTKTSEFFSKNGFKGSEVWSREVPGLSAKYYSNKILERLRMGDKAAEREFKALGFDPKVVAAKGLTRYDQLKISNIIIHQTQGMPDALTLPLAFQNPYVKTMFAMQSYNIMWFNFVRKFVWKEAVDNHNFLPIAKLLGMGYLAGGANRILWDTILGKKADKDSYTGFIKNLGYSGSLGLMGDMIEGMPMGRMLSSPLMNFMNEGGQAGYKLATGDANPAMQFGARRFLYPEMVQRLPFGVGLPAAVLSRHFIEKGLRKKKDEDAKDKRSTKNR